VFDAIRWRSASWLRVLVSLLLLGVVLAYAGAADLVRVLREGDWEWFVAGLALMVVAVATGAIRWRVLLEGAEITVSRLRACRVFAGSLVLNNVLPTSVGGDAMRAWLVGRDSGRLVGAAAATIVDKLSGVTLLFVLGWVALALDPDGVPSSLVSAFFWVTAGLVAAYVVAALVVAGVRPVVHRLPDRIALAIRQAWATFRVWTRSAYVLASLIGLGVTYQALAMVVLVLVGKTIGVELSFALAAVSASIVLVAMLIPVSIGGLGVREGGFVLLLAQADVEAAQATLLSLLSVAVVVLASAAVIAISTAVDAVRAREPATRPARGA
jgi:glycosyltransferase 2 family protein